MMAGPPGSRRRSVSVQRFPPGPMARYPRSNPRGMRARNPACSPAPRLPGSRRRRAWSSTNFPLEDVPGDAGLTKPWAHRPGEAVLRGQHVSLVIERGVGGELREPLVHADRGLAPLGFVERRNSNVLETVHLGVAKAAVVRLVESRRLRNL